MKITVTNYNEQVFWEEKEVAAKEVGCMNLVSVFPEFKRQQMKGFGGAFTEAAGYCYEKLSEEAKQAFLEAYFSKNGLNYNIGRTHINSCDFGLGNYAAIEQLEDGSFTEFDLTRANKYVLPIINDACKLRGKKIELLLSPWSPPAYMKTNGEMNNGGKLKEEYRETWAKYIAQYIGELKELDLNIQYLTVQNEPDATQTWDSCRYSAKEEMEFVRDYLGPTLKKAKLDDIKILVWDHNKEALYDRATAILSDETANEYIYGLGVHWYTGDHFEQIKMVKETYPNKEIFFTEGCVEYSRFMDSNEVAKAEMYAHDMLGNFKNGISAFYDWNLLLDVKGGPNHVGNFCAAPIMATEDGTDFEKRLTYYYIGHFSRYIEKGAYAIGVSSYSSDVEAAAWVNPSGEVVVVLLNRQDKDISVSVGNNGEGCDLVLKAHSITTVQY